MTTLSLWKVPITFLQVSLPNPQWCWILDDDKDDYNEDHEDDHEDDDEDDNDDDLPSGIFASTAQSTVISSSLLNLTNAMGLSYFAWSKYKTEKFELGEVHCLGFVTR